MARKLLALVGAGKGPVLHVEGFINPRVNVRGLADGEELHVKTDGNTYCATVDGRHQFDMTRWVFLESFGKCKSLVCTIEEG